MAANVGYGPSSAGDPLAGAFAERPPQIGQNRWPTVLFNTRFGVKLYLLTPADWSLDESDSEPPDGKP